MSYIKKTSFEQDMFHVIFIKLILNYFMMIDSNLSPEILAIIGSLIDLCFSEQKKTPTFSSLLN